MASINGIWFILIGLIVSVVSYLNEDIRVFLYVGAGFLLYGLIKLLIQFLKKPKKHHKKHHANHTQQHNHPQSQSQHYQHSPQSQSQPPQGFFCRNCGKRLAIHDNFCSHCGMRLR